MVFVPQGWITLEVAKEGGPLFYGLRKSLFMASKECNKAVKDFELTTKMLQAAGVNSQRQLNILTVLQRLVE